MKTNRSNRLLSLLVSSSLLTISFANAASLYWDSNSTTDGAGVTPIGTWGLDNFWNTDSTGGAAGAFQITALNIDDVFFSAGSDAVDPYTVGLNSATQNARSVTFQDGTTTLNDGTLSLGNQGGITVSASTVTGATISSGLTITGRQILNVAASKTLTLNTGTFTRNAGATLNVLSTGTTTTTMTGLAAGSMVNGIVGPWAYFGVGGSTRYATIDGSNNIVGLTGTAAATAANVTSTLGTVNYDMAGGNAAFGAGANINTLRYTGAGATITGNLTTKGIMNVGGGGLALSGTVSGGGELAVNTASGGVTFNAALTTGTTSLVKDGSGRLVTANLDTTYSGPVTVNSGVLQYGDSIARLTSGNITLNGGVIDQRWNTIVNRTLGSGAGQIQVLGGASGFANNNGGHEMRFNNNTAFEVVWGSAFFNPSTLMLQTSATQNNQNISMSNLYDLNGGIRTINVDPGINGASTATFSNTIRTSTGTGGIIKTGNGILILNGSNSYNGGTTINAGTLAFGSIAAMPNSGAVALSSGASLRIDLGTGGDWTTGTSGVGTLGGLLSGLGGAGSSTVTYSGNVGLQLNVGADSTYTGIIANPTGSTSLALTKLGNNSLTLPSDNTFTGAVTVAAGTLNMSGANTFSSATVNGGALNLSGNYSFASATVNGGALNLSGNNSFASATINGGSLNLSGDNAMTGAVSLNAGTLQLAHINAIDTATAVTAATGTTLQLRSNTAATFATPLTTFGTGVGNMTINVDRVSSGSNNQLVLNGGLSSQQSHGNENEFFFTGGNGYTLSIPTLKIDRFGGGGGGGGTRLNPTTTSVAIGPVTSSATQGIFLRLRGTSTGNTLGAITHTGSALTLQKQEAGTWTLTGASNFTGAVAITGGSLRITKNTALGTTAGGVTQSGASELAIDGSGGAVTVGAEALTINGGGISNAGALRNIAGNNTYGGTVTLAAQSRINSDSGTLLLSNATSVTGAGQNLVVGGAGNVTISGAITTTTGFVSKDSAGTLTLSGNNTYSGGTTINTGKVVAQGNNAALGTAAASVAVNTTLQLNNNLAADTTLAIANAITGAGTLEITAADAPATTDRNRVTVGSLSGFTGNISVLANGMFGNFTADNTTNQNLTIAAGGYMAIGNAGTLNFGFGKLDGAGTIIRNVGGTNLATLTLGNGNATGGVFSGIIEGASTTANSGTFDSSGLISVIKVGTGTQTLSGNNTYAGDTTVSAGTLAIGANDVLPDASAVSLGAATLDVSTFTDTAGTLDITGAAVINLGTGGTLAFADSSAVDWTGGTLNITGTLGATSIRFGTTSGGLTPTQLATISVNGSGLGTYILDANGYLVPGSGDSTPPTLTSITDNVSGGTVNIGAAVTYTVTFDEDMNDATVTTADFSNNGTAVATIDSVTETTPGVFSVVVTPTSPGTLVLRINALAVLEDVAGNDLNTTTALLDDTTITVRNAYQTWALANAISSAPGQDKDGDGVNNAIEFLLGGDVSTNDLSKLPEVTTTATDMIFTFERKRSSIDGITGCTIEVGTTLTGWPTTYTVGSNTAGSTAGVVVTENSPEGFDTIILTVPIGSDPKKFARLNANVTE